MLQLVPGLLVLDESVYVRATSQFVKVLLTIVALSASTDR